MSDETPSEPQAEPAAPVAPAEADSGLRYERVREWHAQKLPREDMLARLKESGVDDESARVLVNSVAGPLPPELPSAELTRGTNVLAPGAFSLSDIGLTGHPTVVGQYWMGFGAAILLAMALGALFHAAGIAQIPDGVQYYALRLGGLAAMAFVAWGAFRYSQGITIRRK